MKKKMDLWGVLLVILLLDITGITWGIPRNDYRRFFYSSEKEIAESAGRISEEYVSKSWEMSRDKESRMPRSVFNVIRSFHPDEQNIIKSISNMKPREFNFNPHFFEYPSFLIYFTAFLLGAASVFNIIRVTTDISYYFLNPDAMGRFFLTGRAGVVILSVLGVFFLYKAVENFFDRKTAFFSALALAVTPLYVINSHFLTVDIPMVFWIIFSMYFISLFWKNGNMKFFYMAGLTMGFAVGTKYPAVFVWFLIPLVYGSRKQKAREIFSLPVVRTFFLTIAGFLVTTPYSVFAFSEFRRDILFQVSVRGFGQADMNLFSKLVGFISNTHTALQSGLSSGLYVLLGAGIVYILFKKGKEKIFLAGFIFALIPLLLTGGVKYARYYLIMIPFAAIITGIFIAGITGIFKFRKKDIAGTFFILFLTVPFLKSMAYSLHMSREDIRITAARFIECRIPGGTTVVFTGAPWIFEVPPVNGSRYNVAVVSGENLGKAAQGSYLVIGELQYFLTYGSRKRQEERLINTIEGHGYILEDCFKDPPRIFNVMFDTDMTVHDMVYTHPAIYLFRKT